MVYKPGKLGAKGQDQASNVAAAGVGDLVQGTPRLSYADTNLFPTELHKHPHFFTYLARLSL